jgi:hypothetical protein
MIWRGWGDLFRKIGAGHLAEEPDYGTSSIQPAVEQLKIMDAAEQYAQEICENAACPQFIAGEKVEPGAPVCRGPDGRVYNMAIDPARPRDDQTEIIYIPGEEIQAGHPLEIVPSPDGELENQRADHETGLVAQDGPQVTINELTPDVQEQVSSPPVTTGLQCPQEAPIATTPGP